MNTTRGVVAALILASAAGLALGQAVQSRVQWRSGAEAPRFDRPATDVLAAGIGSHLVVRLTGPITDESRVRLQASGLSIQAWLGDDTYFASLSADARPRALATSGLISGAEAIRVEWKLHRDLLDGRPPAWTLVNPAGALDPMVAVYVTLHRDVPNHAAGAATVLKHGGTIEGVMSSVNSLVAHVPLSALLALGAEDAVQWIEPALPQFQTVNAENRVLVQANQVQASPYNLSGAGVSVLVFDAGSVMTTHQDFGGRVTVIDNSGQIAHATHVAGTVGGSGAASGGNNRGMAPGVTMLSAGVNISGVTGWLYSNPCDIEADYTTGYNQGADLATNSIGTNVGSNGFDCAWEGDYGNCAAVIDAIVRGSPVSQGNPFRVTWAAGNERSTGRCGSQYRTIGPPAGAKNHLSIGSVDSNTDNTSSFSGWGPTDDGRMKPDFSAPGCQTSGDQGVTSCNSGSPTSYTTMCGTSMATPTVAGCASLLLEDFRTRHPGSPDPRNSTLKVIFAQSAADRGNPGPDYQYGYGSVRVQNAVDLMREENYLEDLIGQSLDSVYDVSVPSGASHFTVTLAWDDFPGTGNIIPALVNDLDLEVYDPSGTRVWTWTLDPANPSANATRTQANRLDNLEQVRVDNPVGGLWRVRVYGHNVPEGPQAYSLISSHTLSNGIPSPLVTIIPRLVPTQVDPDTPTPVRADVIIAHDTLVPDGVRVHYQSTAGGPFSSVVLSNVGGTTWAGSLPPFACSDTPRFYFSAQGVEAGIRNAPAGGEAAAYSAAVIDTVLIDSFETDTGWTVTNFPRTTSFRGGWERADPEATAAQPGDDHTTGGGVNCWVTGAAAGATVSANDLSYGATQLTSPLLDLSSGGDFIIEYWRWFSSNTATVYNDPFLVQITNDDGATWSTFESIALGSPVQPGWVRVQRNLSDVGIAPTSQVRVRFFGDDVGVPSVFEAAIDDFALTRIGCVTTGCDPDVNCDGVPDQGDVACMILAVAGDMSCFCQADPDFNRDGVPDQGDVADVILTVAGAPCP